MQLYMECCITNVEPVKRFICISTYDKLGVYGLVEKQFKESMANKLLLTFLYITDS